MEQDKLMDDSIRRPLKYVRKFNFWLSEDEKTKEVHIPPGFFYQFAAYLSYMNNVTNTEEKEKNQIRLDYERSKGESNELNLF